jgi:hypothetical protein
MGNSMNVFMSYSHGDKAVAQKVVDALKKGGFDVWDPETEIFPGDDFGREISAALNRSDAMVVLLSPEGLRYSWQKHEISYALGQMAYDGRLIPVLTRPESAYAKDEIPWILQTLNFVHLHDPEQEQSGLNQIVNALSQTVASAA